MSALKSIMTLASCENQKIYRQRKYRMLPVLAAVVIIAGAAVGMIPGNALKFTMSNYPYTVLSGLNYILAPIAVFMLASDILAGEAAGNEIKILLARPVPRANVLAGKVISIAAYACLLLAEGLILSGIISIIFSGFISFNIFTALAAYIAGFFPLLTLSAMAVMIASMVKSGTSCFSFCLIAYVGVMVLGIIFSGLSPALFTSYVGIGSMVIGSSVPVAGLLTGIAVLSGYTLIFLSVSGLKFSGRDF